MSDTTLSIHDPKTAARLRMCVIAPGVQEAVTRGLCGLSYMAITDLAQDHAFDALASAVLSLSGLAKTEQDGLAPFISGRLASIGPLGIEIGARDLHVAIFANTLLHPTQGRAH